MLDLCLRDQTAQGSCLSAGIACETKSPELLDAAVSHLFGPQVEESGRTGDAPSFPGTAALCVDQTLTFEAGEYSMG